MSLSEWWGTVSALPLAEQGRAFDAHPEWHDASTRGELIELVGRETAFGRWLAFTSPSVSNESWPALGRARDFLRVGGPLLSPVAYVVAMGTVHSHPAWGDYYGAAEDASAFTLLILLLTSLFWLGWLVTGWPKFMAGELAFGDIAYAGFGSFAMALLWMAWSCLQLYDGHPMTGYWASTGCEGMFVLSIMLFVIGVLCWAFGRIGGRE
jgi:hypothetical protein